MQLVEKCIQISMLEFLFWIVKKCITLHHWSNIWSMSFLGSLPPVATIVVAPAFSLTFLVNPFVYGFSFHYVFRWLGTLKDSVKSLRANIMERLDQQGESIKEIKEMIIELNSKIDKFTTANKNNVEGPKTISVCLCY